IFKLQIQRQSFKQGTVFFPFPMFATAKIQGLIFFLLFFLAPATPPFAFALGVVDPASSGVGGGGFMVVYQAKEKKAHALDFRETAPAAVRKDLYIKGGKPVPALSLTGPLAVAVPGEVAGLAEALKRFGTLPLPTVMASAIRFASGGIPVSPPLRPATVRPRTR